MKRILLFTVFLFICFACKIDKNKVVVEEKIVNEAPQRLFTEVSIEPIIVNDSLSIRGLEILNDSVLGYASNKGFGVVTITNDTITIGNSYAAYLKLNPTETTSSFRSLAINNDKIFGLSIGNPALLIEDVIHEVSNPKVRYTESHEKVFYDAMMFWNAKEGIAMGDPTDNCLSVIITRDGGKTWNKVPCEKLPEVVTGEAAFAASDTNIAVVDNHTWILSGGVKSRVFYSPDKGNSWEVYDTPLLQGEGSQGGYSIAFFDALNGFIIGGDYTKAEANNGNKAVTKDGGKTWRLVAEGAEPDYRSCVQYIPNNKGNELVAVGFRGISYSNDYGENWDKLSDASFFTIRFLNDSTAFAAGRGGIAKLLFK